MKSKLPLETMRNERLSGEGGSAGKQGLWRKGGVCERACAEVYIQPNAGK